MSSPASRRHLSFVRISRWNEYSTTKVPLIFVPVLYLITKEPGTPTEHYMRLGGIVAFTSLYLAFGYILNDYADQEMDRRAGKVNIIGEISRPHALLLLFLVFTMGIMVLAPFYRQSTVVWITALSYIMAGAYSLYPIRLKERGLLGVFVSAISQRVFPVLLIFAMYNHWGIDTAIFLMLYTMIGLRWMFIHQILDASNDDKANVRTFVIQKGVQTAQDLLYRGVFPVEICIGLLAIFLTIGGSIIGLLIPVIYLAEIGLRVRLHKSRKILFSLTQYNDIPLAVFYLFIWPALLALFSSLHDMTLIGVLALIIVWQWSYLKSEGLRFLQLVSLVWRKAPS